MVASWYMSETVEDQRKPNRRSPNKDVPFDELAKLGVLYFKIDCAEDTDEAWDNNPQLTKIREERGYTYKDNITCSPEKLENYEEKLKMFFKEHIHSDEEIRLCTGGSGYFDVRDNNDEWIRIELERGDMIILPAGIYHRFTLDEKNFISAHRYFVGEPVWTPINRPTADTHASRTSYLKSHGEAQAV